MTYSVIHDPVIQVKNSCGAIEELGLREIFARAHELEDIVADNPMEKYAVLRLIIAFAMDMLHPEDSYDRQELLSEGKFDMKIFDTYVQECESQGPRFDLFDEEHPFMQSKFTAEEKISERKSVSELFQAIPSGNNHMFFDHRLEDIHIASYSQAFRAMCTLYVFCPPGAQGYPSSVNNTPPVFVIIIGKNLFETIIVNMLSKAELGNIEYGYGSVPWRCGIPVEPKKEYFAVNMLEALTWQPRKVVLIPNDNGYVSFICLQQGKNFKGNSLWTDPHVPYRKKKDDTYASIKPEEGRALWRDISALILNSVSYRYKQPTTISSITNIIEDSDRIINARISGLVIKNNAKFVESSEDSLSLPRFLLEVDYLAELFRDDVEAIESVQQRLYDSVKTGMSRQKNAASLAAQAQHLFLQLMHDQLFGDVIANMESLRYGEWSIDAELAHIEWFNELIKSALATTIREVIHRTGGSATELQKQLNTEKIIWIAYKKHIAERSKKYVKQ